MNDEAKHKPVAIVLGAAVWAGGVPSPTLHRRTMQAVTLWKAGKVSGVLGSGGVGKHPPSEAEVITALCRSEGMPDSALILEPDSRSTEENLFFSRTLMAELGVRRAVIVSDWYHLPRAALVARRLGIEATTSSPSIKGARLVAQIKAGLREIPAYLWYWLRGLGRKKP